MYNEPCFCFIFQLDIGKQPEYQLRVSLYDATYKTFLGRQWMGPLHTAQGGGENKPRLKYNQVHTDVIYSTVTIVNLLNKLVQLYVEKLVSDMIWDRSRVLSRVFGFLHQ